LAEIVAHTSYITSAKVLNFIQYLFIKWEEAFFLENSSEYIFFQHEKPIYLQSKILDEFSNNIFLRKDD